MYLSTVTRPAGRTAKGFPLSGTVLGLGLVSMFTDMSAEMVTAILPMYLIYGIGVGYAQLGAIDGLYTAATAVLRLAGGHMADRLDRPKAVAAFGYGLSALAKLGLPPAGASAGGIGFVLALDRAGKGIRTAPRDAMIASAVPAAGLGSAFGLHRTLDTFGALLGPIIAFGLVSVLATGYDSVFVVSFALAVVGLIVLWFLVNPATSSRGRPKVDLRAGLRLLSGQAVRRATIAVGLLGACTVGDMFLYVAVQQSSGLPVGALPLLPLVSALTFILAATPVGRLADRAGRWRVFLAGHLVLLAAYLLATTLRAWPVALAVLICHGLYYAATDGVLIACVAPLLPESLRGTGIAAVQTAQAVARACGAVAFGLVAQAFALRPAFLVFAAALTLTLAVASRLVRQESTT